jgi:hypothetical protein
VKPSIIAVEVHPQLSHNGHPVDGLLAAGVCSFWPPTPSHCTMMDGWMISDQEIRFFIGLQLSKINHGG